MWRIACHCGVRPRISRGIALSYRLRHSLTMSGKNRIDLRDPPFQALRHYRIAFGVTE